MNIIIGFITECNRLSDHHSLKNFLFYSIQPVYLRRKNTIPFIFTGKIICGSQKRVDDDNMIMVRKFFREIYFFVKMTTEKAVDGFKTLVVSCKKKVHQYISI